MLPLPAMPTVLLRTRCCCAAQRARGPRTPVRRLQGRRIRGRPALLAHRASPVEPSETTMAPLVSCRAAAVQVLRAVPSIRQRLHDAVVLPSARSSVVAFSRPVGSFANPPFVISATVPVDSSLPDAEARRAPPPGQDGHSPTRPPISTRPPTNVVYSGSPDRHRRARLPRRRGRRLSQTSPDVPGQLDHASKTWSS